LKRFNPRSPPCRTGLKFLHFRACISAIRTVLCAQRLCRPALRKGCAFPGSASNLVSKLRLRLNRRGAASPKNKQLNSEGPERHSLSARQGGRAAHANRTKYSNFGLSSMGQGGPRSAFSPAAAVRVWKDTTLEWSLHGDTQAGTLERFANPPTRTHLSRLEGSRKAHLTPGNLENARSVLVGNRYGYQLGRIACVLERQRHFRDLCTRLVFEDGFA